MRVLVIEDYEPIRSGVSEGLREAGFAVDVAATGETGMWYALNNPYDVIILDIMLPDVDGLTILQRIRSQKLDVNVLLLTARDTPQDRITGLERGADDYLVKPFVFQELLARVRALVRRKYESKDPVIRVGDLTVDTNTRQVRRADRVIHLSPREYALLEFLAHRTGQLVTRSEVWEHVYEFNSEAESNVVDVFIGRLRRKIECEGCPKLIHTRWGQGYVLGTSAG
jgi:two-component system, OmpR family, copper resistance phosphate regulon response regulator CusR